MVTDRQLNTRFRQLVDQVSALLGISPLPRKQDRVLRLTWADIPLTYNTPRFGVIEEQRGEDPRSGWMIAFTRGLQEEPEHIFEWVLWREALLAFLRPRIRHVSEAADLGLFAILKYGIQNSKHKTEFIELWKRISPPQYQTFYIYDPTLGFPMFDAVVDGKFLQTVIPWLNTIRGTQSEPLPSTTYTAALERWMHETHQPLNATEVRILSALAKDPSLTQVQLSQILDMKTSTLSQALQRLAQKHLLRITNFVNYPMIGLDPVTVFFRSNGKNISPKYYRWLSQIRYIQYIRHYSKSLLVANFLIPQPHIDQFHQWVKNVGQIWELPPPSISPIAQLLTSWNFSYYKPDVGWSEDFTPILNQMHHIVKGAIQVSKRIQRFRYSHEITRDKQSFPIRLRIEDFTYFKRSTEILKIAEGVVSRVSEEVREAGIPESSHMRYRRRIQKFEKLKLSQHFRYGIFMIGLNTVIQLLFSQPHELIENVFDAGSLLPCLTGHIFKDGSGDMTIFVPNHVAIDVYSTIRSIFAENGIDAVITAKPAWQAFVGLPPILAPKNYDFIKKEWVWDPGILPEP